MKFIFETKAQRLAYINKLRAEINRLDEISSKSYNAIAIMNATKLRKEMESIINQPKSIGEQDEAKEIVEQIDVDVKRVVDSNRLAEKRESRFDEICIGLIAAGKTISPEIEIKIWAKIDAELNMAAESDLD